MDIYHIWANKEGDISCYIQKLHTLINNYEKELATNLNYKQAQEFCK